MALLVVSSIQGLFLLNNFTILYSSSITKELQLHNKMCTPIYIHPAIQVNRYSGPILPGESPIQAAIRRHRESLSLEDSERKNSGASDNTPEGFDPDKKIRAQDVEEKAPEVSESEYATGESQKRRSSCKAWWRDFKHHHLP